MTMLKIRDLRPGMRVDLEGDKYADTGEHPEFEFEYEVVDTTKRETETCLLIEFESGFACGFPPDHEVEVDATREQLRALGYE